MRYNLGGRRGKRAQTGDNNSFWLSFSDMMSGLLLVFVLIMFYSVYQYFDMLEIKTAELLRQSEVLTQKETELEEKDAALEEKDAALTQAQDKLTESETLLLAEQAKLILRDQQLADLGTALDTQKAELDSANAALAAQQAELDAAKAQLDDQQLQLLAAQALLNDQQLVVQQQQEQLDYQQAQLDELVGVRKRIIAELADTLDASNISATVDPHTGAITLDSSILFDSSDSALTPAGKRMIDRFLPVYLDVLLSDEYRGNVSEIIIEGHTDSVGSYMSNLELSQNRALAVASYVLSDEYIGISAEYKTYLRSIMTANGRSESNLIYDENGVENRDASRRVEFKFRLHDEQMIMEMAQLLEDFDAYEPGADEYAPGQAENSPDTPENGAETADNGADAAENEADTAE